MPRLVVPLYRDVASCPAPASIPASAIPGNTGDTRRVPLYPPAEVPTRVSVSAAPYTGVSGDTRRIPLRPDTEGVSGGAFLDQLTVGVVRPTDLGPTTASYSSAAAPGTKIADITGLLPGEYVVGTDSTTGRLALNAGGTALLVGGLASTPGVRTHVLATNRGRQLSVALTTT